MEIDNYKDIDKERSIRKIDQNFVDYAQHLLLCYKDRNKERVLSITKEVIKHWIIEKKVKGFKK